MRTGSPIIFQLLLKAVIELKEHPEAKYCFCYVDDFLKNITNENILKKCSISWDNINKGYTLVWDDVLSEYHYQADLLICRDNYQYSYIIRDNDGNYLDSYSENDQIYSWWPFWTYIIQHLEKVYK